MFAARSRPHCGVARSVFVDLEIWLAMHEDLRMNRLTRAVFAHLDTALCNYVRSGQQNPAGRAAQR